MKSYELFKESNNCIKLKSRNGLIKSRMKSSFTKLGLRRFHNNEIYDFNYFGEIDAKSFIQSNQPQSNLGLPLDFSPKEFKSQEWTAHGYNPSRTNSFESEILKLEKLLDPYRDRFSFEGSFSLSHRILSIEDSNEQNLVSKWLKSNCWYSIKRLGSATISDAYIWSDSDKVDFSFFAESAKKMLSHYDQKASLPKEATYPVLFAQSESAEGTLFNLIKRSLIADRFFQGGGLFTGMLGQKVFHESFSLVDAHIRPDLGVYSPFDGEGFIRENSELSLIESGVLKNVIANQSLAQKYKVPATGNGLKTFDSSPRTNYHSVQLKPGTESTESILKRLPHSIVIMVSGGGDFTDMGDYAEPVEFAYLLEHGELVGRLPALTVKSRVQDMFDSNLVGIANDNYFKSNHSPSIIMNMQVLLN